MEANKDLFDTSDYPKENPLYSVKKKKVLGIMKDECARTPIAECVCLRPKMYSIVKAVEKNIKKAKGVKKNMVNKHITHEHCKEALYGEKQTWHGMNILRGDAREIYGMHVNKISLLTRREPHFHGVLVAEQALSQGAVETFNVQPSRGEFPCVRGDFQSILRDLREPHQNSKVRGLASL